MPWLPVFLQRLGRRSQIPDSGRIKRQPEKRRKGQVHESGCAERKLQKKEKNCLHELLPARDFGRNRDRMWRRWANSAMNQYTGLNGFMPQYDGNFNQTTAYNGSTFAYNGLNQLVGGSMQATYDGLSRCVRRTVGGRLEPDHGTGRAGNWKVWTIYGSKPDEVLFRGFEFELGRRCRGCFLRALRLQPQLSARRLDIVSLLASQSSHDAMAADDRKEAFLHVARRSRPFQTGDGVVRN